MATNVRGAGVHIADAPKVLTFGINARDYDEIVKELADAILTDQTLSSVNKKVLVLGPVDTDSCPYRFDPVLLQEKLTTIIQRSGKLRVLSAIDAIGKPDFPAARYDTMRLEWEKRNAVDGEDLLTFGQLAKVDYMLFGRVSVQTAIKGRETESVYTFNWKMADCLTGLMVWSHEATRTKRGPMPATPEWVTNPRDDSPSYLYALGQSREGREPTDGRRTAETEGRTQLAKRLNERLGLFGQTVIRPFLADELEVECVPQAIHEQREGKGVTTALLVRTPRRLYAEAERHKREALRRWTEVEASKDKRAILIQCRRFIRDYPLATQPWVWTEVAIMRVAEIERARNNPSAAQQLYEQIQNHSTVPEWKNRATVALREIKVGEEDRNRMAWFRDLDNRRVAVLGAINMNGQWNTWDGFTSLAETFIAGFGGEVIRFPAPPSGREITDLTHDARAAETFRERHRLDWLLLTTVKGKFNRRPDPLQKGRESFQFEGEVVNVVYGEPSVQFSKRENRFYGWWQGTEQTSVTTLGLKTMQLWQTDYQKRKTETSHKESTP